MPTIGKSYGVSGLIARRISLFTGLYLFAFVFAHLVNISLGLKSIDAMDEARSWLIALWTNPVGGGLLLVCLFFHMIIGLRALFLRNTLRLSAFDAFQLLLGLSIPILLFPHIISMSLLPILTGQHATYQQVLAHFWVDNLWHGLRQIIGLMVVWLHGCMGLFVWLRLQSWWSGVSLFVYPTVVLLPTLAMLGFVEAGKEVIANVEPAPSVYQSSRTSQLAAGSEGASASDSRETASSSSDDSADVDSSGDGGTAEQVDSTSSGGELMQTVGRVTQTSIYGYLVLLALVLIIRAWRLYPAAQQARIRFGNNKEVTTMAGANLLEISRMHDVAHASLCGGKGRCGTCQVAILAGLENLTALTEVEKRKLQQISAASNIRLACQARVSGGKIHLEPVLPAYVVADDMPHRRPVPVPGQVAGAAIATNADLIDDALSENGDQP